MGLRFELSREEQRTLHEMGIFHPPSPYANVRARDVPTGTTFGAKAGGR